jgi:hypothetical protein
MARRTTHGLTVVTCDVPGCESKFQTYSLASKAREQAQLHGGFTRAKLCAFEGWEKFGLGSSRRKEVDCCSGCKPKPRMSPSPDIAVAP